MTRALVADRDKHGTNTINRNTNNNFENINNTFYFSAPSAAPSNVRLKNLIRGSIMVQWDPVDKRYSNGEIEGYRVYYTENRYYYYWYNNEASINITDPDALQTVVSGLIEGRRYRVAVAAYTSAGQGPRSKWVTITAGEC